MIKLEPALYILMRSLDVRLLLAMQLGHALEAERRRAKFTTRVLIAVISGHLVMYDLVPARGALHRCKVFIVPIARRIALDHLYFRALDLRLRHQIHLLQLLH